MQLGNDVNIIAFIYLAEISIRITHIYHSKTSKPSAGGQFQGSGSTCNNDHDVTRYHA